MHQLPKPTSSSEINCILDVESFEEANDTRLYIFYSYQKITESYIGKEGKQDEYTRTPRVDECKPFKHLADLIKDSSAKFKEHRNYVDNCSTVFPLMKDAFAGKFTELEFSQNLALGTKF